MTYFDRFDIVEAYHVFTLQFLHERKCVWFIFSKSAQLEALKYKPSPLRTGDPSELTVNGKEIYMQLVHKYIGRKSTNPTQKYQGYYTYKECYPN